MEKLKLKWENLSKGKKILFVFLSLVVIFTVFDVLKGSKIGLGGSSLCDCKDNFWDPNNKKYGDLQVMEDTGNLGGLNFTPRRNMVNRYSGMVPFDKLSESDKSLRKSCRERYTETEVRSSNCD